MPTASTQPEVGMIYKIMPKVISAILPIGKDSKNTQQNYSFRGIDSVYNFIQPILAANGLFVRSEIQDIQRSERPSKSGGVMTFVQLRARYYIVAPDASSVWSDAVGEAMDSGDKAVPKAQSVAQKYFFLQMFCIPTEDQKDVENDSPELAPLPTAHDGYRKMASATPKTDYEAMKAKPLPHVKDEFEVEPEPPAPASIAAFRNIMSELQGLGVSEETAWIGIHRYSADTLKRVVVEVADFTTAELDAVNGYLSRKLHATKAERAKKAKS